jgi:hypothetical protein
MQIIEIVSDLARAKHELAVLTSLDPARLKLCTTAINDLETILEQVLTVAWIPSTLPELHGATTAMLKNIHEVEESVIEAAGPMLNRKLPDEMVRFNVALIGLSTMKFQLNIMFEAAGKIITGMPRAKDAN